MENKPLEAKDDSVTTVSLPVVCIKKDRIASEAWLDSVIQHFLKPEGPYVTFPDDEEEN